jgi:hypothetical protein
MSEEIEVDIPDDVLLKLALEAHRLDMKLNDYILQITKEYIEERKNEKS